MKEAGDKKMRASHGATDVKNGVKESQNQRPMSPKLDLMCRNVE